MRTREELEAALARYKQVKVEADYEDDDSGKFWRAWDIGAIEVLSWALDEEDVEL